MENVIWVYNICFFVYPPYNSITCQNFYFLRTSESFSLLVRSFRRNKTEILPATDYTFSFTSISVTLINVGYLKV